jgi:oligopeptide/dipeptide ABC transporter ATP-binding protein
VAQPLLRVRNLRVAFGRHTAVGGVDVDLHAGETLGLVGESGSGKSSLARAIVRLNRASTGAVEWRGEDLMSCSPARLRELRRDFQMVFQSPAASLNPRMTIAAAIAEPLLIFAPRLKQSERHGMIAAMLERVGLDADLGGRYPHELSGGQCQRVAVARAMILNPKLLVCDEPVSSLDVSIQGQIVNLLSDLQAECGTAMLFISHNLGVVRHLSERIMVLYRGRCVELAPREQLFARALHPYTRALLAAAVSITAAGAPGAAAPGAAALPSDAPGATSGCVYRDRCGFAIGICRTVDPPLSEIVPDRFAACHRAHEFWEPETGK